MYKTQQPLLAIAASYSDLAAVSGHLVICALYAGMLCETKRPLTAWQLADLLDLSLQRQTHPPGLSAPFAAPQLWQRPLQAFVPAQLLEPFA